MNNHIIRRTSTESVFSVDKNSFVDLQLKQSTKLLPYSSVSDTISQWDVYKQERNNCSNFRLIVTINPYCTNVLFNTVTEIVKDEGSNNVSVVDDQTSFDLSGNDNVTGLKEGITRFHMINNTEYSKESIGYDYHVGYDFFNNHILRNLSFKLVNTMVDGGDPAIFNTIEDTLRYIDGKSKTDFRKRVSIDDESNNQNITKHLYDNEDLLNITDSINANLSEDNGWFGFTNTSFLPTKKKTGNKDGNERVIWEGLNISNALNNRKKCEFVDMYPDRTLFSFNPKYNKFKHKPEYNWKLAITYPFENYYNHELVSNSNGDGKTNALLINSLKKTTGLKSDSVLLIQSYIKHGLKKGDDIYIYYSNDNGQTFKRSEITYEVENVGDFNRNNKDYFFYLPNCNFLDELENPEELNRYIFRFTRNVNGAESQYYFRKFKKLPNLRYRRENLTDEIAQNVADFQSYINDNAMDKEKMIDFTREQYKLAFASTIYNDNSTQVVFTDTINIDHIVDNLGRPLTQLYLTIIKNNSGYKEWYGYDTEPNYKSENVEFSHCFGKITSGLMYYTDDEDNNDSSRYQRAKLSDVKLLNNIGCYNAVGIENNKEITVDDDEFMGDVVEYIPYEVRENPLTDVYYRFNTGQREKIGNGKNFGRFRYQEIISDDYDLSGFAVAEYDVDDINTNISIGGVSLKTSERPEGYYYSPHTEIPVREFGQINQASHFDIKIKNATPIQRDGIFIKMTSTLPSNVSVNDIIYICDDLNDIVYTTNVVSVESQTVFIINKVDEINWIRLCDIMNSKNDNMKFKVRRKNMTIPFYAQKIGANKYLWREIRNVGNEYNTVVPEYPFANNHFYVTKNINFFLKRQDSDGKGGLYVKTLFPNDVFGNIKTESNYEYKEETEATC